MKTFYFGKIFLLFIGLTLVISTGAQSFIKRSGNTGLPLRQKVAAFQNGDLLIGGSAVQPSRQGREGAVFLTRMDPCGTVVWSNIFEQAGNQLEFKDFAIDDQGQVLVVGSIFDGIREIIFLLEVDRDGIKKRFRTYDSGHPSDSAFSLAIRNGKILVFGWLLEIGSPTTGLLAVFDRQLNFQWGKRIIPFTFEGAAIIDAGDELIGRSGAFHFKFDDQGALKWAREFDRDLSPVPIGGPVEISGGYLFEAFYEDQAFFYKLDASGQLLWKSDRFTSSPFPAAVVELSGGDLLVHYPAPESAGNNLHQLTLSPQGDILQQNRFDSDNTLHIGTISQVYPANDRLIIIGNDDAPTAGSADISDLLIQYFPDDQTPGCFSWQSIHTTLPNEFPLILPDLDVTLSELTMQGTAPPGPETTAEDAPFDELCGISKEPEIMLVDTLLSCRENWLVNLPSDAFRWEDEYPEPQRLLESTGTYRAKNTDCEDPVVYAYQFDRSECDCQIFVPNAFSPNRDGQNDVVSFFSDCQITEMEASVFDRWGNLIYRSQDLQKVWDGTSRQNQAPAGVYILVIHYQLLSSTGGNQEGTLTRDVLLIR